MNCQIQRDRPVVAAQLVVDTFVCVVDYIALCVVFEKDAISVGRTLVFLVDVNCIVVLVALVSGHEVYLCLFIAWIVAFFVHLVVELVAVGDHLG